MDPSHLTQKSTEALHDAQTTQGRTVDFRNTVIIVTSNIGSEYLLDGVTSGGEIKPDARERVVASLRSAFRPEFLNRLDEIVLFKPLTLAEIERIVDLMFNDLRARLAGRQMTLEISQEALRRAVHPDAAGDARGEGDFAPGRGCAGRGAAVLGRAGTRGLNAGIPGCRKRFCVSWPSVIIRTDAADTAVQRAEERNEQHRPDDDRRTSRFARSA
jgi:AAA domain (Cdc48 subfamily)/C-terminal, D2-small domain, of ClpB protein